MALRNPPTATTPHEQWLIDGITHLDHCTDDLKVLVKDLTAKIDQTLSQLKILTERANKHDAWHGREDENIGERLLAIEQARHDEALTAKAKQGVWRAQWKVITSAMLFGGSIVALIGGLLKVLE